MVNFISGAGRETMPPIMATGKVDIFAFIGTSKVRDWARGRRMGAKARAPRVCAWKLP